MRGDVPDILLAADVFVLSSLAEGLPIALLEAMARGLACVASAVGGVPEAIVDGQSGILVRPGDATELAQRLREVVFDQSLRRRLGLAARERIRLHFEARTMARQYENVYRRTLERRRSHRAGPQM